MPNHYSMELAMHHYTSCGLNNVWLKNGFEKHHIGADTGLSIHNMEGLHRAIALTIIQSPRPITGQEFRFLRVELDFSQKALGSLMDKSDQSIAKWEKGEQAIPRLADKAIRDLYMESIGEGVVAGLLTQMAQLDREVHELNLQLEEVEGRWQASA
jgi:DNA-binding transcriptional regulator YiaG